MLKILKFMLISIFIVLIVVISVAKVTELKTISDTQLITYIVQPGQTLWDIAKEIQPGKDPRRLISQIRKINDITPIIQPGQRIRVPKLSNLVSQKKI